MLGQYDNKTTLTDDKTFNSGHSVSTHAAFVHQTYEYIEYNNVGKVINTKNI